jgi:uncharacterized protein (DUF58 family)
MMPRTAAPPRADTQRTIIVPTLRAAMLAALAAPVALVLAAFGPQAWLAAPAAGLVLVALVVIDAVLAGPLADLRLHAPAEAEVGEPVTLTLLAELSRPANARAANARAVNARAALALVTRLAPGGRLELSLTGTEGSAAGTILTGSATMIPTRRGPARIEALWLRWTGPMGLGARQHARVLDRPLGVLPSLAVARSPTLQLTLRDSEFGLIARRIRGEGTQFEALAEYQPGMDRRRIDWKVSARHTRLTAREYEAERNNQIVFAIDCGRAMCEPVAGVPRIDRAVSAALAAAYVALKAGDRAALFGFAARPDLATPFVGDAREFHRLQSAAATLDYQPHEPNFTLALATLAGRLQRRSMVVVFSEFPDSVSAELMVEAVQRLARRHLVLFVTLADQELEALAAAAPADLAAVSTAVAAEALLHQRRVVVARLRQMGVDVVEAPHERFGLALVDAYLAIKRAGRIG